MGWKEEMKLELHRRAERSGGAVWGDNRARQTNPSAGVPYYLLARLYSTRGLKRITFVLDAHAKFMKLFMLTVASSELQLQDSRRTRILLFETLLVINALSVPFFSLSLFSKL